MSTPVLQRDWALNGDGSCTLLGLRRAFGALVREGGRGQWVTDIFVPGLGGCESRLPAVSRQHATRLAGCAWAELQMQRFNGFEPAPGSNSGATGVATPDPGR